MFFNFTFRHYLTNPHHLAEQVQTSSIRGFKSRIFFIFLTGLLLYGVRSWWGMGTESITSLLTTMSTTEFTMARYASLLGSLLWSLIYISFHFFGFAFLLSIVTSIPFKKLLPLQLLMTAILLMEKLVIFLVFAVKGATANVSFLSFGPLAATYLETNYLILFLNQLTITTALIIALQYRFILSYTAFTQKKRLLWILIGIHITMALITAAVGFIPAESWLDMITGGGVGNE